MTRYVLYRLAAAIPVIFGVTLATFLMVRLVPGDPVDIMLSDRGSASQEVREQMRHELGLDQPIPEQYARFLVNSLRGDLGNSFRTRSPVSEEILTRLPNTLKLTVSSLVITVTVGVLMGVLAASFKGRLIDVLSMLLVVISVSIPGFWFGLMLILLFSLKLGWLPTSGAGSWKHLILPAVALGVRSASIVARVTRSSMLDVLQQDYVRTARAKGLRERVIVFRHAFRNALIPIATVLGFEVGALLTGAFIIETVFAYPGIGMLAVQSLIARDFPMIQGIVIFTAFVYVAVNVLVDIFYAVLDPRIRY